jgi:tRNA threonylcarbamoyladenosine biosynthesis protein TsaE
MLSNSTEQTIAFGRELATRLTPPVLVLLSGELGAGKTTLAKGIVSGLGAAREEDVTSPTFTLVHVFRNPHNGRKVYHADLYRVASFHDFETLGMEDVFAEPAVVLVEWPDRFTLRTAWPVVRVRLEHSGDDARRIEVSEAAPAPAG